MATGAVELGLIDIPMDGEIGIRAGDLTVFLADPDTLIIVAGDMNGNSW